MKVCGFTIVRNALQLDYPIVEAITSVLPICDLFIVAVGKSTDDTLKEIKKINSEKIRIVESVWDDRLRQGGRVLAAETDKALAAIPDDVDWCFYIQADEVCHERDYPKIREAMQRYQHDKNVDGLLFNYVHFYGSYDYVGSSWRWYRREVRIIRNDRNIYSYRDAQGFRKGDNRKLNVKLVDASMHHYGWVRDPRAMQRKQEAFSQLYHDDQWMSQHFAKSEEFDYSNIDSLQLFEGTHPQVMNDRIARLNWKFTHDISLNKLTLREKLKRLASRMIGYRVGEYRNYRLV